MAKVSLGFASSYAKALAMLALSLIVLWFVLNLLHNKFGGNFIGQSAGKVGDLASGQRYNFN